MEAEDVGELYTLLIEHGVQIWIDGGWVRFLPSRRSLGCGRAWQKTR